MGLVDFTNPDAVAWFQKKLKRLLDMGVDSFKTDFGERIPIDVVYADGSDPVKMHNYYTYLYNKSVFELIEETKGRNNSVVFARSATAGSQQFPVHWGGDCSASYESMAESMRGGLSLGLSGFGFWSHDIGGFENTATPDLYKRWAAFGLLSSHSRLHGNESYRVPWLFDDEATEVLRFFTQLKCRLMPYIYATAVEANESGVPTMRAMVIEFPHDPACTTLDRQYMLGEMMLVAPIFGEDGKVTYYVPDGTWTNFLNNERIQGGRWHTETHSYTSLPLLVRPNGIVAVGADSTNVDYDFADGVTLHLFELDEHCILSTTIFDSTGKRTIEIDIQRDGRTVAVTVSDRSVSWSVCLRNIPGASEVVGGTASESDDGLVVSADAGSAAINVTLR
jgi:alpha-D-xyloside xylohydrolase